MMNHLQLVSSLFFIITLLHQPLLEGVDGQIFDNLNAGTYAVTIEARGIENMQDIASYTIGPVVVVAGVNATANEAIGNIVLSSWN